MTETKRTIVQKSSVQMDEESLPILYVNEIDMAEAQEFTKQMMHFDSNPDVKEIYVYISSYGGETFAGLAMIEAMLACRKPVNTVGMGICASSGADILICGPGRRWIAPNSFIHIHHTRSRMAEDLPGFERTIKQLKQVEDKIFKLMMNRSKISPIELKSKLKEEQKEWQISAQSAHKYGFVDFIGLPRFTKSLVIENEFE